jgi:hypothetical protein
VQTTSSITAAEILGEVIAPIEPTFAPDFAQMVLRLNLSERAQDRIRELLQRNNAGSLEKADKAALDNYLLVGQLLDLLHAKARIALEGRTTSP